MENRVDALQFLTKIVMLEEMLVVMRRFSDAGGEEIEALEARLKQFNEERAEFLAALKPEVQAQLSTDELDVAAKQEFARCLAGTLIELLESMAGDMVGINTEGVVVND